MASYSPRAVTAVLVLLLACAEDDAARVAAPTEEAPSCTGAAGGRVGECPGDFTLPALDGAFTLSDHAGHVVVVHLGARTPTDEGASVFLADQLDARPDVVAVDVLTDQPTSEADAVAWRDALALPFPVAFDETGTFGADWGRTSSFPTLLVLDGSGQVTARIHDQYETQLPAALEP